MCGQEKQEACKELGSGLQGPWSANEHVPVEVSHVGEALGAGPKGLDFILSQEDLLFNEKR